MAKKKMDLRAENSDLRETLQVLMLKADKLQQQQAEQDKNIKNIRDKINEHQHTIDHIYSTINQNTANIDKQWDIEAKQDNDIKLLFKQQSELTKAQEAISSEFSEIFERLPCDDPP